MLKHALHHHYSIALPFHSNLPVCVCVCVCVCSVVDPEKEAGLDSGFGSPPTDKEGLSSGVDGFKVPEIEFEEYKVQST